MDQIHGPDIQGRRHAHLAAETEHVFGKVEARLAVIEASVDMGAGDIDETLRADRFAVAHQQTHGEGRRAPMGTVQQRPVLSLEIQHRVTSSASTKRV